MITPTTLKPALKAGLAAAVFMTLGVGAATAHTVTYQYYRFRATKLRGNQNTIQLSELDLFNGSTTPLTAATAFDTGGSHPDTEGPLNAIDIGNYGSKWLNFDRTSGFLVVGFDAPQAIDSYNYYTGNDATERDPVSWVLEGSSDSGGPWTIVDVVANADINVTRSAVALATTRVIPDSPPGVINEFDFSDLGQSNVVANGTPVDLYVDALGTTLTVTSSAAGSTPINVTGNVVTVNPPANALTTYTLTAHSSGGDSTATVQVRTVAAPTLSYRYLRFTPVKVANSATVDIVEFTVKNDGTAVPIVAVENPGGTDTGYPASNLIDNSTGTDYESAPSPLIFDLGTSPVSYNAYSMVTGYTADEYPTRWTIEGSNDKTAWTLVQNVYFDVNQPGTYTETGDIPFDGTSVTPYVSLTSNTALATSGQPLTLNYSVLGATSGTLQPGSVTLTGTGTTTVTPSATTAYTLTATNTNGTATASLTQQVVAAIPTSFVYTNFEDSSLIHTNGTAYITNDFAHYTAAGNVKRLRLTDDLGGQIGSAWYLAPVPVKNGFDVTYDAFIASANFYGADGMGFVVQNSPAGVNAINNGNVHIGTNAVSVVLDSYPDATDQGETTWASLEIWQNNTIIKIVDLTAGGYAHGGAYLPNSGNPAAAPYKMHVVYTPPATTGGNGTMTVYVDGNKLIDSFPMSLEAASAYDTTNGKAYVGFVGRTGGFTEVHDVTAWSFTPTGVTTPTAAPVITSYTINTTAHTVTLNYSAVGGKTYRATTSPDLTTWTTAAGTTDTTVGATATSGTFTFSYTAAAKGFFRVELLNP